MSYCGWIPSVTGHLSFSALGESSYPNRTVCSRSSRTVFFFQKRDLLDIVAPFSNDSAVGAFFQEFIANFAVGVSGSFTFAFIGEIIEDGNAIQGQVLLIPGKENRCLLRNLKAKVYSWQDEDAAETGEWKKYFESLYENACALCDVNLFRSGKVKIGVTIPGAPDPDNELEMLVANQCFYFMKDNAHVHQHHDPTHDAITTVTKVSGDKDTRWVANTQQALYRAVIRYKRYRNEKALFRASGILAYAQSFEKACGNESSNLLEFNRAELRASLDVARDEIKHFDAKRSSFIETVRNFFFAVFGLIVSLMLIVRFDESAVIAVPPEFSVVANFAISRYWFVGAVVVILSFAYAIATHRVDPAQWAIIRAGHRLFQGFRLRWLFIFNLVLTIALSALCFWFLSLLA